MEKYSSYKDSGVEWIGEIPINWDSTRLKYLGNLFGGLTGKSGDDFNQDDNPNNKPYIPFTNIFNNTYISKNHFHYVVLEDGEKQNLVEKFDLFFLMSSETHQDLGKSCILIEDVDELYLNSFCKGFRVDKNNVNPLFLNYQLLGDTHKKLISIEGRGFTRINLRQDKLNSLVMFIPPLPEQQQIVSFLDNKTSLIDTLIEKTQQKIVLLKEQRTSLINHIITKGLNPNVEMKDSGVEWIGEIPEHYEPVRLKFLCSVTTGNRDTQDKVEDGLYPFYVRSPKIERINSYSFDGESVLTVGDGVGTGKVFHYVNGKFEFHQRVYKFSDFRRITGKFFYWFMKHHFIFVTEDQNSKSTVDSLRRPLIDGFQFVVPPLSEQHQIVEYLDKKTTLIDKTISTEQKRIELLKEYRQSLISNVVTGKIKVTKI